MNNQITFGIITDGQNPTRVLEMIYSIRRQKVPSYQIIVVGGAEINASDVTWIAFDESIHPGWLTAKKNAITKNARYDLIVYLHDYLKLSDGWYEGVKDVAVNVGVTRIKYPDGRRYHEWTLDAAIPPWWFPAECSRQRQLPYDCLDLTHIQYISGAYWLASKKVMYENPLNEDMWFPSSEDCEWSQRVRRDHHFQMIGGEDCYVELMKHRDNSFVDASPEIISHFRNMPREVQAQLIQESAEYIKKGRLAPCPVCGGRVGYCTVRNAELGIILAGVFCITCKTHAGFYDNVRQAMCSWYERAHNENLQAR